MACVLPPTMPVAAVLLEDVYYSVGGGFIVREGDTARCNTALRFRCRYPFSKRSRAAGAGRQTRRLPFGRSMLANECALLKEKFVRARHLTRSGRSWMPASIAACAPKASCPAA